MSKDRQFNFLGTTTYIENQYNIIQRSTQQPINVEQNQLTGYPYTEY